MLKLLIKRKIMTKKIENEYFHFLSLYVNKIKGGGDIRIAYTHFFDK